MVSLVVQKANVGSCRNVSVLRASAMLFKLETQLLNIITILLLEE